MNDEVILSDKTTPVAKVLMKLATKIAALEIKFKDRKKDIVDKAVEKKEDLEKYKKEYKELKNILKGIKDEAIYKSAEVVLKNDNSDLTLIQEAQDTIDLEIQRLQREQSTLTGDFNFEYSKKIVALNQKKDKLNEIKDSPNRNAKINEILKDVLNMDESNFKIDEAITKYSKDFYEVSSSSIKDMLDFDENKNGGKKDYKTYKIAMDLCTNNSLADDLQKVQEVLKAQQQAEIEKENLEKDVDIKEAELKCLENFDSKDMENFLVSINERMDELEDAQKKIEETQLPMKSNPILRVFNNIFKRGNNVSKLESNKDKKSLDLKYYMNAWKSSHESEYNALVTITEFNNFKDKDIGAKVTDEQADRLGLSQQDYCIIEFLKNPSDVQKLKESYIDEAKNLANKAKEKCNNIKSEYDGLSPEAKEINIKYFDNGKINFSKDAVVNSFSSKGNLARGKMVALGKALNAKLNIENGDYDKLNEELDISSNKYAKNIDEAKKQKNDFVADAIENSIENDEISM